MIHQAVACDDPVIFFEPKRRYWEKAEVDPAAERGRFPPVSCARIHGDRGRLRPVGPACPGPRPRPRPRARLEVIDLRSLSPLDLDPVVESVRRTGRLVVVSEARLSRRSRPSSPPGCRSVLLAGRAGDAGDRIRHPVPAEQDEEEYLPDLDRVLDAVDRSLAW